ncbi:MAG TPA: hypothetical protein DCQ17_04740, partial [Firmicutes bacterium]|nr:hypothetical protein [Bacillota bacterium]
MEQAADCLRRQPQGADDLAYFLSNLRDISALVDRAGQGEVLDDTELYEVKKLLLLAADIQGELERLQWSFLLPEPLDPCTGLKAELSRGQGSKTSFYIADAYDQELAALRRARPRPGERPTPLLSLIHPLRCPRALSCAFTRDPPHHTHKKRILRLRDAQ